MQRLLHQLSLFLFCRAECRPKYFSQFLMKQSDEGNNYTDIYFTLHSRFILLNIKPLQTGPGGGTDN